MTVRGEGRPLNALLLVWVIWLVLPCMGGVLMMFPPKAWPIVWWPRQTPKRGMSCFAAACTRFRQIPALSGSLGPGEIMRPFGFSVKTSSTVILSLR